MEVSGRKGGDVQLCCQPCKQDNSWVPAYGYCQDCAEHLCRECYKCHRKPAPCRNHVLLDRTKMPQIQSSLAQTAPALADLTEICEQHPGKLIEYYCQDHTILGCSPCVTTKHRTCKIDYIPDVSSKYVAGPEYQNLLQFLESLQENFKKVTKAAKENRRFILENGDILKADIKRFRQDINLALDKWEAEVYEEIKKLISEESQKAETTVKQSKKLALTIETTQKEMKALEQDDKINMLYIKVKREEESLHNYQSDDKQMQQEVHINSFTFKPNTVVNSLLQTENTLGTVLIHSRQPRLLVQQTGGTQTSNLQKPVPRIKHPSYEDISARLAGQIYVKENSDKADCMITGIAEIGKNKLAVTDNANDAIKIVDTEQMSVVSSLKLSSWPWDVVQLPEYQLAVSLPIEQLIEFFRYGNGLSKISRLKAGGTCYGISYMDGNLIVTYANTTESVKIISLSGAVLKILYTNEQYPSFFYTSVDRDNGYIYVSDYNNSKLICLNREGVVIRQCVNESFSRPCGLAVLEDGSVLICDCDKYSIFQILADCKNSRALLQKKDGLIYPHSLALDSNEKKLYIGSGEYHNYVNVYSYR